MKNLGVFAAIILLLMIAGSKPLHAYCIPGNSCADTWENSSMLTPQQEQDVKQNLAPETVNNNSPLIPSNSNSKSAVTADPPQAMNSFQLFTDTELQALLDALKEYFGED